MTTSISAPSLDRFGTLRTSALGDVAPTVDARNLAKIKASAEDFEAFFVTKAFEDMYGDMSSDPIFGGGEAENIFRSFLLQEYGKQVARTGGVGVSDMVQKQLLQLQESPR
jgi:Rod binding domain-containing protein